MAKFVSYYRVSTTKQGQSGLGIDAQRSAVEAYLCSVQGTLVGSFTEIESGRNSDREQLKLAVRCCRKFRAMLVVAKLDRLARNVSFIAQLMESGIDFVAADMPEANRLTIHLIAAVAEYERQVISERTKASLHEARRRGKKLGNPNVRLQQAKGVLAAQQKADQFARRMAPILRGYDPSSSLSARRLAVILNTENIPTSRGKSWTATAVIQLRRRLARLSRPSSSLPAL